MLLDQSMMRSPRTNEVSDEASATFTLFQDNLGGLTMSDFICASTQYLLLESPGSSPFYDTTFRPDRRHYASIGGFDDVLG